MHTVTAPATLQDQALAIIRRRLPDATDFKTPVMAAGGEVLAHILCDLERAFSILIDVDEVWRDATVEDLVRLVRVKVANVHRLALIPANDTGPVYLPPNLPPHPQDNRAHVVRLIQNGILLSLMAGGIAGMVLGALSLIPAVAP